LDAPNLHPDAPDSHRAFRRIARFIGHFGDFTDASCRAPEHGESMIFQRLTPIRAVRAISLVTLLVTLASGAAMRLVDGKEFPTIGRGLWWAAETVTTVGYGDVVPRATAGRVLAVIAMVSAIAFLTVVTAAITAALIERERRRLPTSESPIESQLREISDRLTRLQECVQARDVLYAGLVDEASRATPRLETRHRSLGGHHADGNTNT
jgi:voltage-gated potassium channel